MNRQLEVGSWKLELHDIMTSFYTALISHSGIGSGLVIGIRDLGYPLILKKHRM